MYHFLFYFYVKNKPFTHLFMVISAFCFPNVLPLRLMWGNAGETFGETFTPFCGFLRYFAFHPHYPPLSNSPLKQKDSAYIRQNSSSVSVELEGVVQRIEALRVYGGFGGFINIYNREWVNIWRFREWRWVGRPRLG